MATVAGHPDAEMIDFRVYRVAWLPAIAAFVMVMFSFAAIPEPMEPAVAPTTFDGDRAQVNARQILNAGSDRSPGSEGDNAVADLVMERFSEIDGATAADQEFTQDVDGDEATLRNVVVTLPGDTGRTILVIAPRDARTAPAAVSSAAATAALIELAEVLGGTDRADTVVLVSTDASTEGAAGTREFLDAFADTETIDAAIVIAQPGSAGPAKPYVLRDSTSEDSTSIQLVRTAEQAVADQADRSSEPRGAWTDIARLALPVAAGEQAALISEGVDAVAISSHGEEPLEASADGEDDLDGEVLGQFGSAVLATVLAVDQSTVDLEHGPDTYVQFSGNLIPGWALATLALALLAPAGIAAIDGVARASRRRDGELRALGWAATLALPPLGALLFLYLLSLLGIVTSPGYPFDPGRFGVGLGELFVLVLIAAVLVAGYVVGGLLRPPWSVTRGALVPALGAAAVAGALATWLLNPYLALLIAPVAHVWLVAARTSSPSRLVVGGAVLISLLPFLLALRSVTGAVGAGGWDIVLMVADGHISVLSLLALAPVAGAVVGLLALRADRVADREEPEFHPSVQAP